MSWPHRSHKDLQDAGYLWRGYGRCVECHAQILWYRSVDLKMTPVDPQTYALHFATCEARKEKRAKRAEAEAKCIAFPDRQRKLRV
ncbi:MAG: hypothetical protein ACRD8A_12790 [Candidatus Acidiferrales bacterium]